MPTLSRQIILDFLAANPAATSKRDIARGLDITGDQRGELRDLLKELEEEGILARVGKRAFAPRANPPPTGMVQFEALDADGELIGRAIGRDGPFGPDLVFSGFFGKREGKAPGVGDRALCRVEEGEDGIWRARALKIITPEERAFIGLFTANSYGGGRVESSDRKDRRELLIESGDTAGASTGDLVRADQKPSRGYGPKRGVVREVIGKAGDARAASLIAIHTHGIPHIFPEAVEAAANTVAPTDCKRVDLTGTPLITIDPEDARDHDDAVFAEADIDPANAGGWRVLVAIADVAAYVRPGEPLDREARKRGNSTYFPDRVVPMLPERLSADLLSLRQGENRPCLAVEMVFAADGTKRRHRFLRATMRSAAKLSYRQAQDAIDGRPDDKTGPLVEPILKPLWDAWTTLDRARRDREPLDLDMPERRVSFGPDGTVAGVYLRERFDAHRLIEEFMIQANVCAAEELENRRMALLYRVHEEPSDAKIAALSDFLKSIGLKWTKGERTTTARFNRLLTQARASEHEGTVSEMVLRSQAQAVYSHENLGHFGLQLAKYAHFTSPIRRYSDLVVHRALIRALQLGPDGLTDYEITMLPDTGDHLVMTERRSMAAERDATDRYLALFLADRVGAEFTGRISGVAPFGLFIRLAETGADGFCPAATISEDFWAHDEGGQALVSTNTGERYELGQTVQVRLAEATPLTGGLLLTLISPPRPARSDRPVPRRTGQRDGFRSRPGGPPNRSGGPPRCGPPKRGKRR